MDTSEKESRENRESAGSPSVLWEIKDDNVERITRTDPKSPLPESSKMEKMLVQSGILSKGVKLKEYYVELSAIQPWVEGKGYLSASELMNVTADPAFPFYAIYAKGWMNISLPKLTVGQYVLTIRVSSGLYGGENPLFIYKVYENILKDYWQKPAGSGFQTHGLLINSGGGDLWIRIETEGASEWSVWGFQKVKVQKVGN